MCVCLSLSHTHSVPVTKHNKTSADDATPFWSFESASKVARACELAWKVVAYIFGLFPRQDRVAGQGEVYIMYDVRGSGLMALHVWVTAVLHAIAAIGDKMVLSCWCEKIESYAEKVRDV